MYGFIYITTNLINGKQYIGQHKGDGNDKYLGSGEQITRAIKKYGRENFKREILCFAKTREELNDLEIKYIEKYNAVESEMFYNIANGGYVNPQPGEKNGMYGKKHSQEARRKISLNRSKNLSNPKHYLHSQEFREKMSKVTAGENNGMYGRKHTEESKRKMSVNSKGKALGPRNGNYGNKGELAKNGVKIYKYKDKDKTILVKEYNTVRLVLEELGLKGNTGLKKALKHGTEYKGFYWSK